MKRKRIRRRVLTMSRCISIPPHLDRLVESDRVDQNMGRSEYYASALRLLLRKHGVPVE